MHANFKIGDFFKAFLCFNRYSGSLKINYTSETRARTLVVDVLMVVFFFRWSFSSSQHSPIQRRTFPLGFLSQSSKERIPIFNFIFNFCVKKFELPYQLFLCYRIDLQTRDKELLDLEYRSMSDAWVGIEMSFIWIDL